MRTCGLVFLVSCLLLTHEGRAVTQGASHLTCNCNCGHSQSQLDSLMRTLLIRCTKALSPEGSLPHCAKVPKNCAEVLNKCTGGNQSGVYSVDPDGKGAFKVYCDQKTKQGGWTVFQRRKDGSVDFYRGWNDYKKGFGDLKGEFWLGLDKIHRLTQQAKNRLRVELEDSTGKGVYYAEYDTFAVSSERSRYKLSIGTYSGNAGDSLGAGHRDMEFTTKDADNDKDANKNCAQAYKGAWWYGSCHNSNLNGIYHHGAHKSFADGVNWNTWKGYHYSAKRAEMKIRPADYLPS